MIPDGLKDEPVASDSCSQHCYRYWIDHRLLSGATTTTLTLFIQLITFFTEGGCIVFTATLTAADSHDRSEMVRGGK